MKNIVLDTCTIIHILRGTAQGLKSLDEISSFEENPNLIISVVTKAELLSFSRQNKWGNQKLQKLNEFLDTVTTISISAGDDKLIDAYALIDGYSKRKLTDRFSNLLPGSAHKMGKNDLWIAATALVIEAPLITMDADFDHLDGVFLNIKKIMLT